MASSVVQAALDEAGKVVKKQKTCSSKTDACLDNLIGLVSSARDALAGDSMQDPDEVIQNLLKQVEAQGIAKELNSQTKDLHSSISKLGKAVDKMCDGQQELRKALPNVEFDQQVMNQVIAEHFYREGRFSSGDTFCKEAGISSSEQLKEPYTAMHKILQQLRAKDLQPALEWAQQHREQLSSSGQPSPFEFKLHGLQFIHTLRTQGRPAALAYAKQHFSPFQHSRLKHIQRLMGCLLYYGREGQGAGASSGGSSRMETEGPGGSSPGCSSGSPYEDLLSDRQWEEVQQQFVKHACSLLGRAYESPLAVALAAGTVALPALLKLASVMEKGGQDLQSCEQLPVELELGREFVFHSIFACPVSREQSTPDNPPCLLPCNHVLCEQSILKIARARNKVFKCPYCPMEARADNVRPLTFPDVE